MRGRHFIVALLAGLTAAGLALTGARADVDFDVLLDFDVVIGDTGDWYDGWERDDNRVYARVDYRGQSREHYFSDIASAFYVLHERYGDPVRMRELRVPEYGGRGLLDATQAWYFWDDERLARGSTPLILAFYSPGDAREMAYRRQGDVLDFAQLSRRLRSWYGGGSRRIYWRGQERWDDRDWNDAWSRRWDGWRLDADNGWLHVIVGDRWDRPGRPGRGNGHNSHWDDRDHGNGHRDRDRHDRDRGDRDRDRDRDRDGRDRPGSGRGHGRDGHDDGGRGHGNDGDNNRGRDRGHDDGRADDDGRGGSDVSKGTNDPVPEG